MRLFILQFVTFCSLLIGSHKAMSAEPASEKVKFVSEQWDGYWNKDGSGVYYDILNAVYGKEGYQLTLKPWKRAQSDVEAGLTDGIVGQDDSLKAVYPKWPIDVNAFSAFFANGLGTKWPGVDGLKGKRVLWVRGYDIGKYAPGLKVTQEVETLAAGIKMVAAGRADVMIDYSSDLATEVEKQKVDTKKFTIAETGIGGGFIYICFAKGPKGTALAKDFDERIAKAEKSGALKAAYDKTGKISQFYKKVVQEGTKKP